jgi:hypothetical protein
MDVPIYKWRARTFVWSIDQSRSKVKLPATWTHRVYVRNVNMPLFHICHRVQPIRTWIQDTVTNGNRDQVASTHVLQCWLPNEIVNIVRDYTDVYCVYTAHNFNLSVRLDPAIVDQTRLNMIRAINQMQINSAAIVNLATVSAMHAVAQSQQIIHKPTIISQTRFAECVYVVRSPLINNIVVRWLGPDIHWSPDGQVLLLPDKCELHITVYTNMAIPEDDLLIAQIYDDEQHVTWLNSREQLIAFNDNCIRSTFRCAYDQRLDISQDSCVKFMPNDFYHSCCNGPLTEIPSVPRSEIYRMYRARFNPGYNVSDQLCESFYRAFIGNYYNHVSHTVELYARSRTRLNDMVV